MKREKSFHWRRFISLFIFLTFLVVALTGIILYLTPPGRVARWFDWRFLGLNKDQLQAVHTVSSFAFIFACVFHIFVFNWRVFLCYLKGQNSSGKKKLREISAALLLFLFLFLGSIFNWPPLNRVIGLGESLKNSWEKGYTAESGVQDQDRSLAAYIALYHQGDAREILDKMREMGLRVENLDITIKEIAVKNKKSPQQIAEFLEKIDEGKKENRPGRGTGRMNSKYLGGTGTGQMTIEEAALKHGLELGDLLNRLSAGGVKAEPGSRLNRIARENGLSVAELNDMITALSGEK